MAQPEWITEPGNLGTIAEGEFYKIPLIAYDPDYPMDETKISFSKIAGELPDGIYLSNDGVLDGIPVTLKGVPFDVSYNVTAEFAVRATADDGVINDRTFSLTITGRDEPQFTSSSDLGKYFDSDLLDIQLEYSNPDQQNIEITVASGRLPNGVTMSDTGHLYGYIEPFISEDNAAFTGYDNDLSYFDQHAFDIGNKSIDKNYEFTLKLYDGITTSTKKFSIFVYSKDTLTSSNTNFTADSTFLTADITPYRNPYLVYDSAFIGTYRHNNEFFYKLNGIDPDGGSVSYSLLVGFDNGQAFDSMPFGHDDYESSLPIGLSLDPNTGWLHGDIGYVGITEKNYAFDIKVTKNDTNSLEEISSTYRLYMTVLGDISTETKWNTDPHLGDINNGQISTFEVSATVGNYILHYRLKQGEYNNLPQGLELMESGRIVGQISYQTLQFDSGNTTFNDTTFDQIHTFTVEAYDSNSIVSIERTFTIRVLPEFKKPNITLQINGLLTSNDDEIINDLLHNHNIMKPEIIYRADDPNFGVTKEIIYIHALGLNPLNIKSYLEALDQYHYKKRVYLGNIKTARALDDNGDILYEVVYSDLYDDIGDIDGETTVQDLTVYPNSLTNMRNQVIDTVGQASNILPRWMLSEQADGSILGFTQAWVIAYTKPTHSDHLAYLIRERYDNRLNEVDFTIDRYTYNAYDIKNWNVETQEWDQNEYTIFDNSQTTFDNDSCKFVSNIDTRDRTDKYNKYFIFPRERII